MVILNIFLTILYIYILFFNSYFLFFSLAGRFFRQRQPYKINSPHGKFLVLIPSYKEDAVIVDSARLARLHNYPRDKFDVCVIADNLKNKTIEALKNIPINVLEVNFKKSTKAKSINLALKEIHGHYDFIFILDADNIMGNNCLARMNDVLQSGYKAVQGHRTAKNKNTSFAILDGMSEEINNHIFRQGHRALGLSSALIGSGMGFEYQYYKDKMKGVEEMGGEDKEMELRILKDRNVIAYLDDADIFDEKVDDVKVFAKQRTRWLAGQFRFLRKYGKEGIFQLFRGNFDYFNKFLQTLIPPRVIVLGTLPVMTLLSYIFDLQPNYLYWLLLLLIMALAMLLAIPNRFYNRDLVKGLLQIPKAIIFMTLAVFRIGTAHKTNFHTPHGVNGKADTELTDSTYFRG